AYHGQDAGDLYGPVIAASALDPAHALPIALTLDRRTEAGFKPVETDNVRLADFRSPLLSAFWGRPITMRAGVVLPPNGAPGRRYPTVYHVHGYGGDYSEAWLAGPGLVRRIADGQRAPMVHVFLDASFSTGHHVFADSVNNGPWGRALTQEFIPY